MDSVSPFRVVTIFQADSNAVGDRLRGVNDLNSALQSAGKRPLRLLYNLLPDIPPEVAHEGVLILQNPRSAKMIRSLQALKTPTVSLDEELRGDFPGIYIDDYQIGVTGAGYFLERGFERFAFCEFRDGPWSQERCRGFRSRLAEDGKSCDIYDMLLLSIGELHRSDETPQLVQWLRNLPKPVGLMCSSDFQAAQMIDRILRLGMRVPEDIAVLGVANSLTLCMMARPTLSSIAADDRAAGYHAMEMLYDLMSGNSPQGLPACTPTLHVVERESTDIYGFPDREVGEAYRLIRQATGPMSVKYLTERLAISRRSLELRFTKVLGITPGQMIRQTRVTRAQTMLSETQRSIDDVARRTGFADARAMARVFQRLCGKSPRDYRKKALADTIHEDSNAAAASHR